jgi:hypothetical protein
MEFITIGPMVPKKFKNEHYEMDFCELLFFQKKSHLRMHTLGRIGKIQINMENEFGTKESIMCVMYQNPYQIHALNVKRMSCDYCLFIH